MRYLWIWTVILFWIGFASASDWSKGDQAFAKGDYAKALEFYTKARLGAGDDRRLNLNLGTTLFKLGRFAEAKTELDQAVYSQDSSIASQASYNLANVRYRLGEQSTQPAERISQWREAVALCKRAVDFKPTHEKAKRNAEFIAAKLKEELDKQKQKQDQNKDQNKDQKDPPLSEQAKKALARAMQLVAQGRYKEAKAILDQTIQQDPTAKSLGSNAQRVQDLWDISEGREPSTPIDASQSTKDLQVL